MDRQILINRQTPLKEHYQSDPGAAVITLAAEGSLGEGVSCSLQLGQTLSEAGLHPATGGDGSQLCSGDLLLQALVACAGVTLKAVAINRGMEVTGTVSAEGDLDVRGTLGTDKEALVGFSEIRLGFHLDSTADSDDLDRLVQTTERYCVVLQTLVHAPVVRTART